MAPRGKTDPMQSNVVIDAAASLFLLVFSYIALPIGVAVVAVAAVIFLPM